MSNKLTVIRQRNISCVGHECPRPCSLIIEVSFIPEAHSRLSRFHAPIKSLAEIKKKCTSLSLTAPLPPSPPIVLDVANCRSRKSLISSVVADAFRPPETGSSPFRILYRSCDWSLQVRMRNDIDFLSCTTRHDPDEPDSTIIV